MSKTKESHLQGLITCWQNGLPGEKGFGERGTPSMPVSTEGVIQVKAATRTCMACCSRTLSVHFSAVADVSLLSEHH